MSRIGTDHLARTAFVYIRQSTPEQVRHNLESQRRQYALAERARALGWREVVVLDEDLGRSGSGVKRPGFERLLAAICEGTVGAVVSIEASRLARNGRDWHTLLEFCALVGSLIIDEEGVYDPRLPNDRLLLGMKGTLSEMELSTFRQRSREAIRLKAIRGELFQRVAIGFRVEPGSDAKEPDRRVQTAISLVFQKFREFGSVRQVLIWLRQEGVELPSVAHEGKERRLHWRLPVYQTILGILTNPVYAGLYLRSDDVSSETRERPQARHPRRAGGAGGLAGPYPRPSRGLHRLGKTRGQPANNRGERRHEEILVRGPVREGSALLAGLLRCGHCGRKLHVSYSGRQSAARYHCRAPWETTASRTAASPSEACASNSP